MLEVLFTQDSKVEDLFCGASSGSEPSLFFSNYFFSLGFQPIQDDFQHDFARMTDADDSSVVQAELQVALLGSVIISDWVHGIGHSPVLQILLQISVRTSNMVSPPAWTSSSGILSTPADFPFFSDATAISTSSRRIGCRSSSWGWLQSSTVFMLISLHIAVLVLSFLLWLFHKQAGVSWQCIIKTIFLGKWWPLKA